MGLFDFISDIGDAIYDAGYNLSLQPTIWSIEHEVRKLERTGSSNTTAKPKVDTKPEPPKPVVKKTVKQTAQPPKVNNDKVEKKAISTSKEKTDDEKIKALEKELAELKKKKKNNEKKENIERNEEDVVNFSDFKEAKLKNLKSRAAKLITAATDYMSGETKEIALSVNDEEKEIINGVASMFDFGKIFEDAKVADLKKYDPKLNDDAIKEKYIVEIDRILEMKNIKTMMKKINSNKKSVTLDNSDDEIIHPVFFDDSTEREIHDSSAIPMKGKGISNNLFKKLEKAFLPHMGKTYHRYEKEENGFIDMFYANGSEAGGMIRIDPGLVMGKGKLYVLANFSNDICFVDTEHHDIITKILNNNFYQLTPDEYQVVVDGLFRNTEHYQYYDLSNTSFLSKLSSDEFQKLGKKLTFVSAKLALERTNDVVPRPEIQPRLRLTNWKSVDNFDLISDERVISPLHNSQQTFGVVELGLKVEVRKDDVIEYKNNKCVSKYHIDKYGNM